MIVAREGGEWCLDNNRVLFECGRDGVENEKKRGAHLEGVKDVPIAKSKNDRFLIVCLDQQEGKTLLDINLIRARRTYRSMG